ncbi:MAG TPA: adenylate/guanylate cyclase domain-containing protein [Candidatus Dormibacteraeota bacterium]|nr:adenylate/guanylate cyclase domain-containing protein [Candidatus Dormibacteraeota bacterium]
MSGAPLPSGSVTFLFTDIEGSTKLMQEIGDAYVQVQVDHHAILRKAFQSRKGAELRTEGDSFFCVFQSALDACGAAADAQRGFAEHAWPEGGAIRVRIGLHTGEAPLVGNEYIGLDVHHAARVASAAHGGQVVISEATRSLVAESLPADLSVKDLGVHRLKDLARPERLYQLVIEGVPDTFPALRTLDTTPNNLPTQLTSFVGREAEAAEAKKLLAGTRLLTLTGPGGIGKTRLSLQLAADLVQSFPDGVYFVPLSAVTDPDLIASVIAQSIGLAVTGTRRPLDVVLEYLRGKKILLVLDNFEQLMPEGAPVVSGILHDSADVKAIVSSRAVLRVYGEQEFAVQPLRVPDVKALPSLAALSQFEAVRLFIDRAVAARHDFQVTNENAPAVAGICERVDGLPLAIELAAARVKLFSPQALLGRLETSLNVLAGGSRDLPGRQQTLRGAIAWSHDLLDEPQRRLFARFSVFARGANLEQAEEVCGPSSDLGVDVLAGLDELADQSLLRRMPDFEEPRVLMLQVIREYAAERLQESGEADAIRKRHAVAYQHLAEEAAPNVLGADQKKWLDRLELDHDNFRTAFDWTVATGDADCAMALGAAFWRLWQMRGHLREGRARMEAILAMPGAKDHPAERARALEAAGGVAYWQADMAAAANFYNENLALARASGDKKALADALYNASFPPLVDQSDIEGGLRTVQEALPLYRELGDELGVARVLWTIGNGAHQVHNRERAVPALDETIAILRRIGKDRFSLGWAMHTRAVNAISFGEDSIAAPLVLEGLEIFVGAGDVSAIVVFLDDAAAIAKLEGDTLSALRLAGAAARHQMASGAALAGLINVNEGRPWEEMISSPDERKAWDEGQAMSIAQAVAEARASLERRIIAAGER